METRQRAPIYLGERYEVIDLIASGGMAAVYRGWDFHIPRYVAIKAMRPSTDPGADVQAEVRFLREAQAAAQIAHPNVVRIFDYVEDRDGTYLIMEYVDGQNLKRTISDHGPMNIFRTLAITEQVCSALAAAHDRGMVHRDIKPQNILLTPEGRVRLTDFGIVHVAGAEGLTKSGIVLGTADYLSPEQAYGEKLGPPSDLYSLGIVMYEMLTGEPPFSGANPVSVAMRHASEQVPSPRLLNPHIPVAVEAVWRTAVAKEPRKRYRTAGAFARALRKCRLDLATAHDQPSSQNNPDTTDLPAYFPPDPHTATPTWRRWLTRRQG